jgi:hypothetical protein
MNKILKLIFIFLVFSSFHPSEKETTLKEPIASISTPSTLPITLPQLQGELYLRSLFAQFPSNSFSWEAFKYAMLGKQSLEENTNFSKPNILTIIDFSKPSTEERLFVVDLKELKILTQSLVAHGRNSGENFAKNFSNDSGSFESSLGFYKTAETYYGSKGFSMRLDGLEKNINCQARSRAIVVHAADYVSKSFAQAHGRLGRSQGCPALPKELTQKIIQQITGGSLLFIYAPVAQYINTSKVLKSSDINAFIEPSTEEPSALVKG